MRRAIRGPLALLARGLAGLALAGFVGAGAAADCTPLPSFALEDQHGKPWTVTLGTERLLFAADMAGSNLVNPVLAAEGAGALDQRRAVYVADISAMPAMVASLFALPALRELPFPIGLAREANLVAVLPREKGAATVLTLRDDSFCEVRFVRDEAELRAALERLP